MVKKENLKLSDLLKGDQAVIIGFEEESTDMERLSDMGLHIGTQFRIIKFAPLGDPIELKARGFYLSIRKSLAKKIIIKRKQDHS